jgi:hypothetical protein
LYGSLASIVSLLFCRPASASAELDAANAAVRALDFDAAVVHLDAAVREGKHSLSEVIAIYELSGEALSIAQGVDAGERAFRKLLAIDPEHALPPHQSPVIAEPFQRARDFIAHNGALRVSHKTIPIVARRREIRVNVDADPLSMVAGIAVHYKAESVGEFAMKSEAALRAQIPVEEPTDYYIDVLDRDGNVIATIGAPEHWIRVVPATAPGATASKPAEQTRARPRVRRLQAIGLGLAVPSVGLLAAGIGLNVVAERDYSAALASCSPHCFDAQLGSLNLHKDLAIASYAVGATGLAAAAVLWIVDLAMHRRAQ